MVPRRARLKGKNTTKQPKMRGSLFVIAGSQQGTASCGVADLCYTDRCFITLLLEIP